MTNQYIQSVLELLQAGEKPEVIFKGLKHTLESRGHIRLYHQILSGVLRRISSSTYKAAPELILVSAEDKRKYSAAIKEALAELEADNKDVEIIEDKTITGGFIVSHNHNSIDASYKTKLLDWYRNTISK